MKIANQEATSNMSDFFFFNATRSVPQQNLMFRRWVRLQRGQRQKRGMKPHCLVCLSFLIRYSEKKASPFLPDSPFFSNPLFLWKISNPPFYKYLETSLPLKGREGRWKGSHYGLMALISYWQTLERGRARLETESEIYS